MGLDKETDVSDKKLDFLRYEVGLLSLQAALSTRNKNYPIYSDNCSGSSKKILKKRLRQELYNLEVKYIDGKVTSDQHCNNIELLSKKITEEFKDILYGNCFRFGVSQKILNLYLKYLWTMGIIAEPPHCPLDGIISTKADLYYIWTESDSRIDYESIIFDFSKIAYPKSCAVWELENFKRRDQ
ncbi:hypothetical protein [uncultured Paenalcaligenes sp.]|uniref:hypothetical protein n=1 Tax=uncultured Paenalcaligenes sp. TaxID=1588925 RepID=UPI0026354CAF|nr:hypothetical protein [uncultured Paenalcaligenes sp.]